MVAERYGWRAKVGIISPEGGVTITREWASLLPEGVAYYHAIMGITDNTPEELRKLRGNAIAEARKLAIDRSINLILFACTSGSFIGGPGYEQEIISELESATGIQSTTTTSCVLTAFADLGVKRIAVVGPYLEEVLETEITFLKHHGIETLYSKGMGYVEPMKYIEVGEQPYIGYRWAKEAFRSAPGVDAIFLTCMVSPILRVVDALEQETGKPVVSSCSAAMYGVLKKLGIKDPVEHYGKLLKLPR